MIGKRLKVYYSSKNGKLFLVSITLLAAWFIMTTVSPVFKGKTGRLFSDTYDRSDYFERGKWFTEHTPPLSEYPQIPTLLFGINNLTSMWAETDMQLAVYLAFFSFEMLFILFLVINLLLELLPPNFQNYAFLMLLPPTLYFTYNRFDILPAFLCLTAYSAATKRQWTKVSIILAVATFTKWYPVLLFPGFFMYAFYLESKFQWKMIIGFAVTSIAILLLSYLFGGFESVLATYQFHMARNVDYIAFPVLINNLVRSVLSIPLIPPNYLLFFFIMQISAPIMIIFVKLESLDQLIDYCIVVMGLFVLFSRIWSPQWFLWLLPFLIISAKNAKTVWLIIVYNISIYLCFPLIFDSYGKSSYQMQIAGLLTYLILIFLIFRSIKNLKQVFSFSKIKTDIKILFPPP